MNIEGDYKGKVVLVTGGAGSVGTNLCRKLVELNATKVI
ncbi:polysaccharide biosynthesis protein [Chloroflexota bacterium]